MKTADTFRYITLGLTVLALFTMPRAVALRHGGTMGWIVSFILLINFFGACLALIDHLGDPIVWYYGPRILLGSVLALVYVGWAYMESRK